MNFVLICCSFLLLMTSWNDTDAEKFIDSMGLIHILYGVYRCLCNFEWMSIDEHISSNGIRTLIYSDKLIKQRQTNTQWRMFPSTSDYFRIHFIWLEKPYKIETNVRFKCGHLSWNLIISSPYFTMFLLMCVSLPMLCVAMFELYFHWFENAHIMLSRKIN